MKFIAATILFVTVTGVGAFIWLIDPSHQAVNFPVIGWTHHPLFWGVVYAAILMAAILTVLMILVWCLEQLFD